MFVNSNLVVGSEIFGIKEIGNNNVIINSKFVGSDIVIGNNCTIKNTVVASGTYILGRRICTYFSTRDLRPCYRGQYPCTSFP